MPKFFVKENYVLHYELESLLKISIRTKKNTLSVRIQSITMVKTIYCIQHTKLIEAKKKWRRRWKGFVQINKQLMNFTAKQWKT